LLHTVVFTQNFKALNGVAQAYSLTHFYNAQKHSPCRLVNIE